MKYIVLILVVAFSFTVSYSQDTLIMKSGVHKLVFIQKIEKNKVQYTRDIADAKIYKVYKADVYGIRYKDGRVETFSKMAEPKTVAKKEQEKMSEGALDAEKHYKKYKAAGTGTLITSLASPLVGLIPAIACASKTPSDKNLNIPDSLKAADPQYHADYAKRAKRKKAGKVWQNWGIALGVNIIAIIFINEASGR